MLRNHEYFKVLIPRDTLHRDIHEFMQNIPCPDGKLCKEAYLEVERRLEEGEIDFDDYAEKRIDLLVELWKDSCPQTIKALLRERDIISHFYNGGP